MLKRILPALMLLLGLSACVPPPSPAGGYAGGGGPQPSQRDWDMARSKCPDVEFKGAGPNGFQWHCPSGRPAQQVASAEVRGASGAGCPQSIEALGVPCSHWVKAQEQCPGAEYRGIMPDSGRIRWHCPKGPVTVECINSCKPSGGSPAVVDAKPCCENRPVTTVATNKHSPHSAAASANNHSKACAVTGNNNIVICDSPKKGVSVSPAPKVTPPADAPSKAVFRIDDA